MEIRDCDTVMAVDAADSNLVNLTLSCGKDEVTAMVDAIDAARFAQAILEACHNSIDS